MCVHVCPGQPEELLLASELRHRAHASFPSLSLKLCGVRLPRFLLADDSVASCAEVDLEAWGRWDCSLTLPLTLACFLIKVVCLFVFLGLFEDIFGHGSTDPCADLLLVAGFQHADVWLHTCADPFAWLFLV